MEVIFLWKLVLGISFDCYRQPLIPLAFQELLLRRVACEKSDASPTAMGRPSAMSARLISMPSLKTDSL